MSGNFLVFFQRTRQIWWQLNSSVKVEILKEVSCESCHRCESCHTCGWEGNCLRSPMFYRSRWSFLWVLSMLDTIHTAMQWGWGCCSACPQCNCLAPWGCLYRTWVQRRRRDDRCDVVPATTAFQASQAWRCSWPTSTCSQSCSQIELENSWPGNENVVLAEAQIRRQIAQFIHAAHVACFIICIPQVLLSLSKNCCAALNGAEEQKAGHEGFEKAGGNQKN